MPLYKFAGQVTVSAFTTIEAPDYPTAVRIAEGRDTVFDDGFMDDNKAWIISDPDGEIENIHLAYDDENDE